MAENSYADKVFVGKLEGKGPPERPRKDNVNIYGKKIGWIDLLHLVEVRDSGTFYQIQEWGFGFPEVQ